MLVFATRLEQLNSMMTDLKKKVGLAIHPGKITILSNQRFNKQTEATSDDFKVEVLPKAGKHSIWVKQFRLNNKRRRK